VLNPGGTATFSLLPSTQLLLVLLAHTPCLLRQRSSSAYLPPTQPSATSAASSPSCQGTLSDPTRSASCPHHRLPPPSCGLLSYTDATYISDLSSSSASSSRLTASRRLAHLRTTTCTARPSSKRGSRQYPPLSVRPDPLEPVKLPLQPASASRLRHTPYIVMKLAWHAAPRPAARFDLPIGIGKIHIGIAITINVLWSPASSPTP
jgi:hypothetical protein